MFKSKYIAKLLFKLRIPSFDRCDIHSTCNVSYLSVLAKVKMGKYSYVGAKTSITDAEIGNFCSIGGNVSIGGGIHPMNMVSMSPVFLKGKNFLHKNFAEFPYALSETVRIGNDVWIGDSAYIKAGVKIGDGAVIGAHAVVTHDVEPYAVMAGVPAVVIRKRFSEEIIQRLISIQWWDWSEEKIQKYGSFFENPEALIQEVEE